jgi:SAM-dependent methyltransferase
MFLDEMGLQCGGDFICRLECVVNGPFTSAVVNHVTSIPQNGRSGDYACGHSPDCSSAEYPSTVSTYHAEQVTYDKDRTRAGYDTVADRYAEEIGDELAHKPLDRALLTALVEASGPVAEYADIGCGPGHVARFMADLGASVTGFDLSPAMIARARADVPDVTFQTGDMTALDCAAESFDAIVAFYSLIHLDDDLITQACGEFARVLRPGGHVLVAFHEGDGSEHVSEWWGHEVDLEFRFLQEAAVSSRLTDAGLQVEAMLRRAPHVGYEVETTRIYLQARKPGATGT